MLDTVRLTLGDYTISGDANLDVERETVNMATDEVRGYYPLFPRGSGFVMGKKAYHNADDWNFTLQPQGPLGDHVIVPQISFSVPKLATGSNYEPADFKATETAFITAERELRSIGVHTNIETATLSRLDACKNVLTSEAFPAYAPVLAALKGTRMNKRGYGTSFLWENSVHEVSVYDKRAEMKRKKKNVSGVPRNVARFEYRLLKSRKCRDILGFRSAGDLLIGFDEVKRSYVRAMEKQLFRCSPCEFPVTTVADYELQLKALKDDLGNSKNSNAWFDNFLRARGIASLLSEEGAVITAVENLCDNRMMSYRVKKKLEQAKMDALALEKVSSSKRTNADRYRELECGVLED